MIVHPSWLDVLLDPLRLEILYLLSNLAEATAAELTSQTHASGPTLRKHLEVLVAGNLVRERRGESDGLTPGRPPTRFSVDPNVRESAEALFSVLSHPLHTAPARTRPPHRGR
jgi:DNA-binding transcriptional ArsR family regulator